MEELLFGIDPLGAKGQATLAQLTIHQESIHGIVLNDQNFNFFFHLRKRLAVTY